MRFSPRSLLLLVMLVVGACTHEGNGSNGEEDRKVDIGKFGSSRGQENRQDGGTGTDTPQDPRDSGPDTAYPQYDASNRDGASETEEGGTKTPDYKAGTFEVTVTFVASKTTCVPYPEKTTLTIARVDSAEYSVTPTVETRWLVREPWFVIDEMTLVDAEDTDVILEFTKTDFTGRRTFPGYSVGQSGPGGLCNTTGYTLKGVRKLE